LSILTDFENFRTAGMYMKFATKPIRHYPPHLRYVATLPWEICSKFHTLSSSAKILKIGLDLTKLQRVWRWELFLRHSIVTVFKFKIITV